MKKVKKSIFSIFAAALIISISVSCNKENPSSINGQESSQYALGCQLLPNAEYMAVPLANAPSDELKTLPTVVILATPPVGNQGSEGSCVAWGTTYAGRSIDWYMSNENTSYSRSTNTFSPKYVYNQIKISTCASGAYVTSGLNLLKTQGVCTWNTMPYDGYDCTTQPTIAQRAEAANFKIGDYSRISITTTAIKTFLANNQAVIVAGPVNTAFEYLGNGQVLGAFSGSVLGGHCYCVVGYDDSKNAFKFQNSWGTGWASSGFGWINYNNITSWWSEAYVISTTSNPPPPPPPPTEILSIRPSSRTVTERAGTTSFAITSNCYWSTSSNASWCTVTPSGTGNGTMVASFIANPGAKRTATITISSSTITIIATVVQRRN